MSDKHLSFVIPVAEEAKKQYDVGYETGFIEGGKVGYNDGYTDGKGAEWNNFWDNFQNGGGRTDYAYAFKGWTNSIFKPKYDIKPTEGYALNMFQGSYIEDLASCGVTIDFSQCTSVNFLFSGSNVKKIGILDFSGIPNKTGSPNLMYVFSNCSELETIEKVILPSLSTNGQAYYNLFQGCVSLKNLTIEGVITSNGFNVSDCTLLTKESLLSIINALTTVTTTRTVTLGEENIAKLTDDEIQSVLDKGWTIA